MDFEPVRGSEANKTRPAVIVSRDAANRSVERNGRGVITVVPLTSNTVQVLSFQVLIPAEESGLARDSKAQVEQLRAVTFQRVGNRIGQLPPLLMKQIDRALGEHLAI
ncbi:type II toxin-antitoxin system toxin endoribonuclease MazF9 [Acrocarpospora macrocephala]|uniref:mRNA interferase n=1 Tax=Acrocarpospora macrocephala TaxID=150177 RepID=A0A5M3XDP1_9ACTN|nr:type II toxin-antitoxin system PemK/MazF family toxin [Acrocarpospora macrocephala]GES16188.1 endoribonuclease MazF9 [Acrocarpospora macrocephala]